jgi:hypothetical protein
VPADEGSQPLPDPKCRRVGSWLACGTIGFATGHRALTVAPCQPQTPNIKPRRRFRRTSCFVFFPVSENEQDSLRRPSSPAATEQSCVSEPPGSWQPSDCGEIACAIQGSWRDQGAFLGNADHLSHSGLDVWEAPHQGAAQQPRPEAPGQPLC